MKTFIINGTEIMAHTETRAMLTYANQKLGWRRNDVRFLNGNRVWNPVTRVTVSLHIVELHEKVLTTD